MGNKVTQPGTEESHQNKHQAQPHQHTLALRKLFEKFKLTENDGNTLPGELSMTTFEGAFKGPLHSFGELLYKHMLTLSSAANQEKITQDQFVTAGNEILTVNEERQIANFYFHLFSQKNTFLTKQDAKCMFEASFALTLSLSKILYEEDGRDTGILDAMVTGLFGSRTEISIEVFNIWLSKSCPRLFHSVHNWVLQVLKSSSLPQEMEEARLPELEEVISNKSSLSMSVLWLLSIILPPIYTKPPTNDPSTSGGATRPLSSAAINGSVWTSLQTTPRMTEMQGWKLLYNSSDHGLSINRFNHHVSSYHAPTIMFLSFEGGNLYCLAVDKSWSEGPNKFGGADCRVIQLLPTYRVAHSGEKIVQWNESVRGIPKGINIGCTGKADDLHVVQEFDVVRHQNMSYKIHKIEVWGCGSDYALQAQRSQKDWEKKAVQKELSRKLKPEAYGEDWRNGPDKQLLQWGGVDVGNHRHGET